MKNARSRRDAVAYQSPAKDGNGNRILRVVRRDATDMADLETEKVIQVRYYYRYKISNQFKGMMLTLK